MSFPSPRRHYFSATLSSLCIVYYNTSFCSVQVSSSFHSAIHIIRPVPVSTCLSPYVPLNNRPVL